MPPIRQLRSNLSSPRCCFQSPLSRLFRCSSSRLCPSDRRKRSQRGRNAKQTTTWPQSANTLIVKFMRAGCAARATRGTVHESVRNAGGYLMMLLQRSPARDVHRRDNSQEWGGANARQTGRPYCGCPVLHARCGRQLSVGT